MNVIVIGPAGSGKSTFVKHFLDFLKENNYDVKAVNLDPASDPIYDAHADIRKFVKTEDIMKKFNLGINGALVKSMELALQHVDKIIVGGDYVLYDTPGQMELFLYLKHGIEIAKKIAESDFTVGIFIVDSTVANSIENYISILAQNAVISLRMSIPTVTVFNKSDIVEINFTPSTIKEKIKEVEGILAEIIEQMLGFIEYTTVRYRTLKISAINKNGFEDVLSIINEVFCSCGDLS
ncbi:MAG TPA: GTPase [Aquificaceae bacterium]|nr:GTPase [Aquificaceae bacterium]HIP63071.1 GTPase [Archaeoglobus profundus]